MESRKTRIAILGGGPAALAAAWEITESPNWKDRFEVDVYTMGWRLGGKCASGRNQKTLKNFEHGLHILCGFYHNTFGQLHDVYDEWNEYSSDCPLKFDDAFFPKREFSLMQKDPWWWREVRIKFPDNGKCPGKDPPETTILEILTQLTRWLGVEVAKLENLGEHISLSRSKASEEPENIQFSDSLMLEEIAKTMNLVADKLEGLSARSMSDEVIGEIIEILDVLNHRIRRLDWPVKNADLLGLLNLLVTIVRGALKDRVWDQGYDTINDLELREWLVKHKASERALRSVFYNALYHYSFGYIDGDAEKPNIAAGTGLRNFLRMMFHVHGSIFYQMNGGMGEVFVLPYYDVLRRRGVDFHFFHKVTDVVPNENHEISEIRFQLQAVTKDRIGKYDPTFKFLTDGGSVSRRCWPDRPFFEQLKQGDDLNESGIDLEDALGEDPPGSTNKSLVKGNDFDICVLAIPTSISKEFTEKLSVDSPRWRNMMDKESSTPTISAQLWSKVPAEKIRGFTRNGLVTGGRLPLDTWADMSFLLAQESVSNKNGEAESLSYFVGAFPKDELGNGNNADLATKSTETWLKRNAPRFMPGFCKGGKFSVHHVLDMHSTLNSDPAKYYVNTPSGTVRHRIRSDNTDFTNLFLAGDWTKNNSDMGAVESAVMSGRQCARAISGYPSFIYGETDFG
ncbi:MAG: NAD(P)-binding protein [Parasphingorhabdus sp.]